MATPCQIDVYATSVQAPEDRKSICLSSFCPSVQSTENQRKQCYQMLIVMERIVSSRKLHIVDVGYDKHYNAARPGKLNHPFPTSTKNSVRRKEVARRAIPPGVDQTAPLGYWG